MVDEESGLVNRGAISEDKPEPIPGFNVSPGYVLPAQSSFPAHYAVDLTVYQT